MAHQSMLSAKQLKNRSKKKTERVETVDKKGTITIHVSTKERLSALKKHPRATYEEVILELLENH